jgi:stringent starvation protein B
MSTPAIKPYLIRAIYEWCTDNDLTPYLSAVLDTYSNIPAELAKDGEIILNISHNATCDLLIGNEVIQFTTRFNGEPRKVEITVGAVKAIFAKELGHGLTFIPESVAEADESTDGNDQLSADTQTLAEDLTPSNKDKRGKSFLKIVK